MRIIPFAHTTHAMLAGAKTRTRRWWAERTAASFIRAYEKGDLIQAYNFSARNGGRCVAIIRLTASPVISHMLEPKDWVLEGFAWMTEQGHRLGSGQTGKLVSPSQVWTEWVALQKASDFLPWVVDFELVENLVQKGVVHAFQTKEKRKPQ